MAPSLLHIFLGIRDNLVEFRAAGMGVGIGGFPALAPGELIDGHAGLAALDVPQRLVDAADGVVQHRTVLPVRTVVARLPDVFDAVGGLAEQKGFEVLLDCGFHKVGALGESRAAIPVEAVLIGGDLHDGQTRALRLAFDDADVLDSGRGHGARSAGCLFLSMNKAGRERESASCCGGFQKIATDHGHGGTSFAKLR
jgi:hypothetical protein